MKKKLLILLCTMGILGVSLVGCGSSVKQSVGVKGSELSSEDINKLSLMGSSADAISYNFDNLVAKVGSSSYDLMSAKSDDIFPQIGMDIKETTSRKELGDDREDYVELEVMYTLKDGTSFVFKDNYLTDNEDFRLFTYASVELNEKSKDSGLFGLNYNSTVEEIEEVFGESGLYYPEGDVITYWWGISVNSIPMEVEIVYNKSDLHIETIEVTSYFDSAFSRYFSDEVKAAVKEDLKK